VETAGSKYPCTHLVIIPPGGKAVAHYHNGYETVIHIIKGRAETKYNEAGDFLLIPSNVSHQSVNLSNSEQVLVVVAKNDPKEQESVAIYETSK
jgi:uncharacterized RmlC-like cupin family protein